MPGVPVPLTRRALLVGLAAGATAACTGSPSVLAPSPPAAPTADQLAREAAIAREQELSRLSAVALAAYPVMTAARTALSYHAQHIRALSETLRPSPSSSASVSSSAPPGSASPSVAARASESTSRVTGSRAATARSLASALVDASDAHRSAVATASPDLARLLASIAGSDAALAAVLRQGTT
jgi:hypothetical protein